MSHNLSNTSCRELEEGIWRMGLLWGGHVHGSKDGEKRRSQKLRIGKVGYLQVFLCPPCHTSSYLFLEPAVISTPTLARSDIDLLSDLPFSCIIIDEVHNVKNPLSKTSKAFNTFDCVVRFGLTGTAIQNDYMELWTILDWTNPGRLGNKKQWRGFVANPLKEGQSRSASEQIRAKAIVS